MNILKRPRAENDLDHYAAYFTRSSGIALAVRFLEAAERTIDNIARLPGIGSPFPVDNPDLAGLRALPIAGFPNHIIFYLWPSDEEIVIIRVMNAARHVERQLEKE